VSFFNYIIICLTETWLSDGFFDNELGLSNAVFRCDRNSDTSNCYRGGGALIAFRNDVVCELLPTTVYNVEHLFVRFHVHNVTFVVCSVYIPLNSPVLVYESFMSAVQATISLNTGCVFIICGDFNLPDTSWSNDDYGLIYCSSSGPRVQCVPKIFAFNNFFQLNGVSNHFGGILDLVFSNNCSILVENSEVVSVPCDPYHPALVINLPFAQDHPLLDNSHKYFNFRRACYPDICSFLLSFNWLETIVSLDVDQATNALYDALHFCVLNFVPEVSYSPSKFPLWFSHDLKSIVISKKRGMPSIKFPVVPEIITSFLISGHAINLSTKGAINRS